MAQKNIKGITKYNIVDKTFEMERKKRIKEIISYFKHCSLYIRIK